MSLRLIRPRLGELFLTGLPGSSVPADLRALAREFGLGGVLLRPANTTDVLHLAELAREARALTSPVPPWVASHPDDDVFAALRPDLTAWPPVLALGRADDAALTQAWGAATARQTLALGCTLTFGPVLDLVSRPDRARRGLAAIGDAAASVSRHGALLVDTWTRAGLACVTGHFPGLGGATPDPVAGTPGHAPLLEAPPDELRRVAWQPFRAAIDAGVSAIVVAHVYAPALDEAAPACWSSRIVREHLRHDLAWSGVVVADDLARMPLSSDEPAQHPAVRCLLAGCDVLWRGDGDVEEVARAIEAVIHAAERDEMRVSWLEDALRRHEAMKAQTLAPAAVRRLPAPPPLASVIGRGDDERVAERMRAYT